MAREEITKKNAPLIEQEAQKMGGMLPPELLQQFQQQNELEIAQRITELTNEMVNEEQELMNKDEKDPLINLKQQELMLRAQEVRQNRELAEQRLDLDLEKLNFEGKKLEQKDNIDKERIQSQEDIADLRAEVSLASKRGQ